MESEIRKVKDCIKTGNNVAWAKKYINYLIGQDPTDTRLYVLKGDLLETVSEKKACYLKALELNENYSLIYKGLFTCDVMDKDYEMASYNINKFERKCHRKKIECNIGIINILLDYLLDIDKDRYEINNYLFDKRLSKAEMEDYVKIVEAVGDASFESAYYMCLAFIFKFKNNDFKVVADLIQANMQKVENHSFQKIKKDAK